VWGLRALAVVLRTYQKKYRLNTIAQIISRWAPSSENDTKAYITSVARACWVGPEDKIIVEGLLPLLIPAIVRHENGCQPYSEELIAEAIGMK
jgi:hypothetical protein